MAHLSPALLSLSADHCPFDSLQSPLLQTQITDCWAAPTVGQKVLDALAKPPASKERWLIIALLVPQPGSPPLAAHDLSFFYLNKIFLHHNFI